MSQLEERLATLSDGTEVVAAVLGNWHNVLRAVHMASTKIPTPKDADDVAEDLHARTSDNGSLDLPETLVRIPVQDEASTRKT